MGDLWGARYHELVWSFFTCLDATAKKLFAFQRDPVDGLMQDDLYGLLGVAEDATYAQIKRAYHDFGETLAS